MCGRNIINSFYLMYILSAPADVVVPIRRCVIQIQIERSSLRAVIPVATEQSRRRGALVHYKT